MLNAIKTNWPEFLIEAWCLGTFMVSACVFGVLLFHPAARPTGLDPTAANLLMGLAMGATAVAIITSPLGKRSGAHFNPAVTFAFLRLKKIGPADASFYIAFQFIGGIAGVLVSYMFLGELLAVDSVDFVVTVPGRYGLIGAFIAESVISFVMMSVILFTSNSRRLSPYTPIFAGCLVALYIVVESPISGMSMNPARSFSSSVVAGKWMGWWIYFIAPIAAMLAAAEFFVRTRGLRNVVCAKLDHFGTSRCIFNCDLKKKAVTSQDTATHTMKNASV